MKNPKTTIAGYLLVITSLATMVAHVLTGDINVMDIQNIVGALAGIGLISAQDGGR